MSNERLELLVYRMPVRWGDMDALGHVNNAAYFRFFEQARIAWFEQIGAAGGLLGEQAGPLIVTAACTFLTPITYPAQLRIQVLAGSPGRSSFDMAYEIRDDDFPDRIYATGITKVVWTDFREKRSAPIPPQVRALLAG